MNVPTGVFVTCFGILHLGGDPNLSNSISRRDGFSQDILDVLPVKTSKFTAIMFIAKF
jgi:hypothetical protein